MLEPEAIELAHYRLERAKSMLEAARHATLMDDYYTAANRSYYALFSAIRALLALELLDYKKHSAVIGKFREIYIKGGQFDVRYSKIIGDAFDVRNNSDYEDFYLVSREDVKQQIEYAADFLEDVQVYLDKRIAE